MQKQEEVLSRLRPIFDIFLRENFSTTNNVYFEKLLTHLQAKGKFSNRAGPAIYLLIPH